MELPIPPRQSILHDSEHRAKQGVAVKVYINRHLTAPFHERMSGELGATGFFKHLLGLQIDISLYANLMRFALLTGIQHWLTQGNQGGNIDTQHEGAYFVVRASLVSSERLGGGVTLTYS